MADGGTIDADNELESAFPGLDGSDTHFRKLSVSVTGKFFETVYFKLEVDFSNAREIKDNWFGFLKYPVLKNMK